MRPACHPYYPRNITLSNVKKGCYFGLRQTRLVQPSDFNYIRRLKLGTALFLPSLNLVSSLFHFVSRIFFRCAKKQMVGIAARRIVALVKNPQISNLAIVEHPAKSVTRYDDPVDSHSAITLTLPGYPLPTITQLLAMGLNASVFVNATPKFINVTLINIEKEEGFWNGFFSSLHRSVLCGLSAISRATYTGDGDFFYGLFGRYSQG